MILALELGNFSFNSSFFKRFAYNKATVGLIASVPGYHSVTTYISGTCGFESTAIRNCCNQPFCCGFWLISCCLAQPTSSSSLLQISKLQ
ncbi:hypothetical protein L1987_43823 [Smallanthus sonchifolius]|uniref:Uncharacterized protein n=1 Tax=Smallanthus sonchifolius TaxID=185202 RepID=A0ACB9GMH2_9ASTR|nr:hypothetical protein L1987_43823 [Smallanthus sonchifolius]